MLFNFNKLFHTSQREAFQLFTKPWLHCLFIWAPKSSWTMPCADPKLMPTIAATCADMIHQFAMMKASALCVCWWSTSLDFIHYTCSSCFKVFYSFIHLSMIHNVCSILCAYIWWWISDDLFLNGTIAELIAHTFDLVASCVWLATHHPMQPCDVTCQCLPLTCII